MALGTLIAAMTVLLLRFLVHIAVTSGIVGCHGHVLRHRMRARRHGQRVAAK